MFADREDIEARRVGEFRCLKDFLKPLLGADCIAFIDGGASAAARMPASAMTSASAAPPLARRYAEAHAPACPPSNENGPYSARCIKFLSGWYWQPNPADRAP